MRTSLVLRKDQPDRKGMCSIELVVHHRNKRLRFVSGLRCLPEHWSEPRRRVTQGDEHHARINRKLVELESKGKAMEIDHPGASLERIRALLSAPDLNTHGAFTEQARAVVEADKDVAWHTRNTWKGVLAKFDRFAPGVGLGEIDQPMMKRFQGWCVRSGNHKHTAGKSIRMLRILYRRVCDIHGIEPKAIARGLDLKEDPGPPKFVPLDRIADVLAYRSERKIRQLAHDLWCFSFLCAGIRFRDIVDLKWKQLDNGWLRIAHQHKTGHFKASELTPKAEAILARYKGGTYVFKVCGDRKVDERAIASRLAQLNPELHAISDELGIVPHLTTHTARHTWTEWALVNGVPYPLMMQMLGIKSMKAFLHYISRFNTVAVSDVYGKMRDQFA